MNKFVRGCLGVCAIISNATPTWGGGLVVPGYQSPTPPSMSLTVQQPVWKQGNQDGGACSRHVIVYGPAVSSGNRVRDEYRNQSYVNIDKGQILYCLGVQTRGRGTLPVKETLAMIAARLVDLELPYYRRYPNSGPMWPHLPRACYYWVQVNVHGVTYITSGNTAQGACDDLGVPPPASCSITGRSDIEHRSVSTGAVYRSKRITLDVLCDRTASVRLDVPRSPAVLRSGSDRVSTGLFLNENGVYSATVTAGPHGTVDVLSVVDTDIKSAGEYNGTVVLTATWD